MFTGGLVSVSFRNLKTQEIIDLVALSGLSAIEWGGDVHVPHGNAACAREVRDRTLDAGLQLPSYGSYYRVGVSEQQGLAFASVLESAVALETPVIRVWAGSLASAEAKTADRQRVIDDTLRIADLAAQANKFVAFEFHANTLTDSNESAIDLLQQVDHPQVLSYWQPPNDKNADYCADGLQRILPRLAVLHLFHWHWVDNAIQRLPLADGREPWQRYLQIAGQIKHTIPALLEFVANDDPQQFLRDAKTLKTWLAPWQ